MKKTLFYITIIFGLTSCTNMSTPDSESEEQIIDDGAFPAAWSIDEIAKAAHPSAVPSNTHVLTWKRETDDRPLLVESCLVLCRFEENDWQLVSLYRHPDGNGNGEWRESMMHLGPGDNDPIGHWEWHRERYSKRPSNKDVYDFMDKYRWCLGVDKGWRLLGGGVCKTTWESVLKEKPSRDFRK